MDETVQAEAMSPQELSDAIRAACLSVTDTDALDDVRARSQAIRDRLVQWVQDAS
jgi:uncharacterized protein YqfA (UPF0365 family)